MKAIYKTLGAGLALAVSLSMTSCLEETFPTNGAVSKQVSEDLLGLNNGMSAYMTVFNGGDTYDYMDCGFAGFMLNRDAMTMDAPPFDTSYDYFTYFAGQTWLGNYSVQSLIWRRYYYLIQKANLVLGLGSHDPESFDAPYVGDAFVYRAMAYYELLNQYEYRLTGVARLDDYARANGIIGLTVPIITENTTEADSRKAPRAPYWQMYRFILSDLNKAEACLRNTHSAPGGKSHACLGVAYGMKARLWLDIATRFNRHPESLSEAISHEADADLADLDKLGVTSDRQAYENASRYAKAAIAEGFTPLTKAQWFDPKTGFNTPNNSWLFAIIISTSDDLTSLTWRSFTGFTCPEASWGVATPDYGAYRCIGARLWKKVQDCDWRRATWIAPEDVASQEAFSAKYSAGTNLSYAEWSKLGAYAGIKYHPNGGDMNNSPTGIAISIPLMRIEEMYFIDAEARVFTEGPAAGKAALESFMNTYRTEGGTYSCPASLEADVVQEIIAQKRIELWCEGVVLFDFKRLEMAMTGGYPGTNVPKLLRSNSYEGYVAPWSIFYIPDDEAHQDPAIKLNPDPTDAIPLWEE